MSSSDRKRQEKAWRAEIWEAEQTQIKQIRIEKTIIKRAYMRTDQDAKRQGEEIKKGTKEKSQGLGKRKKADHKKELTPAQKRDLDRRRELALTCIDRLKRIYPDTRTTLTFADAWQLLISLRLAAQCTDKRVDQVTPGLYAVYPTVEAISQAPVDAIEKIVHPCGLGPSKARDIKACMTMLHEVYQDRVPDTMEELLRLPGVGRKSANLILGDVFGKPAVVTDTHCIRLSNRIGLVTDIKEPAKVEKELWKVLPDAEANQFCHRLVDHGRAVCMARSPRCEACILNDVCAFGQTVLTAEK